MVTKNKESFFQKYEEIKSITLIALFSDDDLMNILVLKGGNALNLIYKIASRASIDLDFSIESFIDKQDFQFIQKCIERTLNDTFDEHGYNVIDFKFYERPKNSIGNRPEFWGGYRIEFKVIEKQKYLQNKSNKEQLSRLAETVGENQLKTFFIDISKYEYCESKLTKDFSGFTIYVYSPEMIAIEKLRAICQQMPEYLVMITGKSNSVSERARDFYDIYNIVTKLKLDLYTEENVSLLKHIFAAKAVPIQLLNKITETKNFHFRGYDSLKTTIYPGEELKEFDFYFNFVVTLANKLTSLSDSKSAT